MCRKGQLYYQLFIVLLFLIFSSTILAAAPLGTICGENGDCLSYNCRKEIDSDNFYCADVGKECSNSGALEVGYDSGELSGSYICSSRDISVQCNSATVCDIYSGYYCDSSNWILGDGTSYDCSTNDHCVSETWYTGYRCNGLVGSAGACVIDFGAQEKDSSQVYCESTATSCVARNWLSSVNECCGDDSGATDTFEGNSADGCCCSGTQIGTLDDAICFSNSNKWCLDGSYCNAGVVRDSDLGTTLTGDNVLCGCDNNANNICDTDDSGTIVDGRCVQSSCCAAGEIASGETTTGSLDWDSGDESCGCSGVSNGVLCDSTANDYLSLLNSDGACIANNCCSSDVVSGETVTPVIDSDESCGCSGKDGLICDSNPGDGLDWDGICSAGSCVVSGSMVDSDQDGTFETYLCSSNLNGATCDSAPFDGVADGVCIGNTCDISAPAELDCGVDGCSNSDKGNGANINPTLNSGFACTTNFASFTNDFFTQQGTSTQEGCDVVGDLCYDGNFYRSDCSSCGFDFDITSTGALCDSDSTIGGNFQQDGICTSSGCNTDGEICVDKDAGNLIKNDCSSCGSGSLCEQNGGSILSISLNGRCAQGNCCTTTYIDVNKNSLYDDSVSACASCSAGNEYSKCSNDVDGNWDGVCFNKDLGGYTCLAELSTCDILGTSTMSTSNFVCTDSILTNSIFVDSTIINSNLTSSTLTTSTLEDGLILNSIVINSNIDNSHLDNSDATNVNVTNSNIVNTDLCSGLEITGASISNQLISSGIVKYGLSNYYAGFRIDTICSSSQVDDYVYFDVASVNDGSYIKVYYKGSSTGQTVTLNASEIGASDNLVMWDNGQNSDDVAGDAIYTTALNVYDTSAFNVKDVVATITDGPTWNIVGSLLVDNTNPQGYIELFDNETNAKDVVYKANVLIDFQVTDGNLLNGCRFANDDVNDLSLSPIVPCTSEIVWSLDETDGLRTVYVEVFDIVGNNEIFSDSIILNLSAVSDVTPPTAATVIDGGIFTSSTDSLYFTWSDAFDFESSALGLPLTYNISLHDGFSTVYSLNGTYSTESNIFISLIDGRNYTLTVDSINAVGLSTSSVSDGIVVDLSTPAISTIIGPDNVNWLNLGSYLFNLSSSDTLSGVNGFSYSMSRDSTLIPDDFLDISIANSNISFNNLGEGSYYFKVRAIDLVGNVGPVSQRVLNVDTSAPSIPQLLNDIQNLETSDTLTFEWLSSSDISGIADYWIQVSDSSDFSATIIDQSVGISNSYLFSAPSPDSYFARVRAQNSVGLWSEYSDVLKGEVDVLPPVISIIKPRNFVRSNYSSLSVSTDERAICSFRSLSGLGGFNLFDFTNATYHETLIFENNGLANYNISCQDLVGNEANIINSFTVNTALVPDSLTIDTTSDQFYMDQLIEIKFNLTSGATGVGGIKINLLEIELDGDNIVNKSFYDLGNGEYSVSFYAPNQITPTVNYQIRIRSNDGAIVEDTFLIDVDKSILSVTSPSYPLLYNSKRDLTNTDIALTIFDAELLDLDFSTNFEIASSLFYDDIILTSTDKTLASGEYNLKLEHVGFDEDLNPIISIMKSDELVSSEHNLAWSE